MEKVTFFSKAKLVEHFVVAQKIMKCSQILRVQKYQIFDVYVNNVSPILFIEF